MKRVLVTGANGFVGRHVLQPFIDLGYEVHAVSTRFTESDDVEWHCADLLNLNQVDDLISSVKPSHLLHLAWYTKHGDYWSSEENLHWVQASIYLLQRFVEAGGERVVFAGSCAEYDWDEGVCREPETRLDPDSLYGAAKVALYQMSKHFCHQKNVSFSWGRLFHLYGPDEAPERLAPSIIKALMKGEKGSCRNGEYLRDFLYVRDAADAFVKLVDSNISGPVNIGSGESISLKMMTSEIAALMDRRGQIECGKGKDESKDKVILADVSRLRKELGWHHTYGMEQGLIETIEWWKNEARN